MSRQTKPGRSCLHRTAAAGSMSWERCCLGLPSVVVALADNQRPIAEALDERGAAAIAGWSPAVTAQDIALALAQLIESAATLSAMSRAAASMCDGIG
ncbi:MAG: hypothetical protein IH884_04635, partial [Myxococcales bacterium]|nr:hypothetical protein [Myxococcales bacterium]